MCPTWTRGSSLRSEEARSSCSHSCCFGGCRTVLLACLISNASAPHDKAWHPTWGQKKDTLLVLLESGLLRTKTQPSAIVQENMLHARKLLTDNNHRAATEKVNAGWTIDKSQQSCQACPSSQKVGSGSIGCSCEPASCWNCHGAGFSFDCGILQKQNQYDAFDIFRWILWPQTHHDDHDLNHQVAALRAELASMIVQNGEVSAGLGRVADKIVKTSSSRLRILQHRPKLNRMPLWIWNLEGVGFPFAFVDSKSCFLIKFSQSVGLKSHTARLVTGRNSCQTWWLSSSLSQWNCMVWKKHVRESWNLQESMRSALF